MNAPNTPNPNPTLRLLDVVALTQDVPTQGLARGQVGTIVEDLGNAAYEVEFADEDGHTYAMATLRSEQLIVLHYRPGKVA